MIIIAGAVPVQPDKREEAAQVALRMAELSKAEDGCAHYHFYSDLADPNTFFIFEEWRDAASLDAHGKTEHMAWFREQLPNFLAGEPKLTRYEAKIGD
ncbi:MAG: putative quinol monooxygenase [Caldilineaceae bacterium]